MSYAKAEDRRAFCRRWGAKNKEKIRNYQLKFRYGISRQQYDVLFDRQNGKCALCLTAQERPLFVDHHHTTGVVRGLLCIKCNTLIGYYERSKSDRVRLEAYVTGEVIC